MKGKYREEKNRQPIPIPYPLKIRKRILSNLMQERTNQISPARAERATQILAVINAKPKPLRHPAVTEHLEAEIRQTETAEPTSVSKRTWLSRARTWFRAFCRRHVKPAVDFLRKRQKLPRLV